MDTKIYEYLIAVSEHGNITKAAEQCFISQPALTQHIKKLEAQLGVPLFERIDSRWHATRQGEIVLTAAQRMRKIEHEMEQKIETCKAQIKPTYRVFVEGHLRNLFIQNIWPKFEEKYPNTKLTLISGDTDSALEYLQNQMIDIGIFPVFQELPVDISCIPLNENEYRLVLPPGHPLAEDFVSGKINDKLIRNRLEGETFILHQSFSLYSTMQHQILNNYGIQPQKILYSHAMQPIARMVSRGLGVSFLPGVILSLAAPDCPSFSLDPPCHFQHVAAFRKSQGLTPMHALMADLFIHHYQQFR